MTGRKPTIRQTAKARREMLQAIDVFRRQGYTREAVQDIAASMFDVNTWWAERMEREG